MATTRRQANNIGMSETMASQEASSCGFAHSLDRLVDRNTAYFQSNEIYEGGRVQEAACWAHVRRKFDHQGSTPIADCKRSGRAHAAQLANA